ncbi:uncharacterized protein LY79DRAFT_6312 [Colletotrichum navitas]|uniref:Uncharacterized protein n=1 Tax=Colletotrichum navitas TaxID=681940 RepID=A0AAD8QCG6_9PEZI|nr:uncharacterized protein LY79DRAFT_6312 [Colletotrichum navitas]KAK1600098.1 hypothetical protein LY79DRAFT_6312 [Colletotrichum navitas]
MFCSSLRKRPEWTPAIPLLTGSAPRLQESRLSTHDIALPLPQQQQGRFLRLVLLSPKDVGAAATEERLERLFNLDGGRDAAVVFLLDQQGRDTNPTEAFMTLQIDILNKLELPLIPLASVAALPSTLANLQTVPVPIQPTESPAQVAPISLFQHMSSGSGPLSEHATNLLSELGRSPCEVAVLAATDQGRAQILDLLGPAEGTRVLSFLAQERPVFA